MFSSIHPIAFLLAGLSAALMLLERSVGTAVMLKVDWRGDVKRETRWLAQYGQITCTYVASAVLFWMDPRDRYLTPWQMVLAAGILTSIAATAIKRVSGRVRPGYENAGKFLGFSRRHANWRESFPSSHTACAVALSYVLAAYYPSGAPVFWCLALACGILRYLLDAHWPSDVFAGAALGWAIGAACWHWLQF